MSSVVTPTHTFVGHFSIGGGATRLNRFLGIRRVESLVQKQPPMQSTAAVAPFCCGGERSTADVLDISWYFLCTYIIYRQIIDHRFHQTATRKSPQCYFQTLYGSASSQPFVSFHCWSMHQWSITTSEDVRILMIMIVQSILAVNILVL